MLNLPSHFEEDLQPSPSLSSLSAPVTRLTTLPNGIRVVSEHTPSSSSQFAHIGIMLDAGTVDEVNDALSSTPPPSAPHLPLGTAHLYERLFWSSTESQSTEAITQHLGELGATPLTVGQRENLAFSLDLFRTNLPAAAQLLAHAVQLPLFHPDDVERERSIVHFELESLAANHFMWLSEELHAVAYRGAYARSPIHPLDTDLSSEVLPALHRFRAMATDPARLIIGATGVDHDELLQLVGPQWENFHGVQQQQQQQMKKNNSGAFEHPRAEVNTEGVYRAISFEQRMEELAAVQQQHQKRLAELHGVEQLHHLSVGPTHPEFSHALVAFPTVALTDRDFYAVYVITTLLGGGGSFSAGGPGKGMYARLYLNALNRHHWLNTCKAFFMPYRGASLVGIYGEAQHAAFWPMVEVLLGELPRLAQQPPDAVELQRAKNLLKAQLFSSVDTRHINFDDMMRQTLYYGHRKPFSEHIAAIDAVSVDDIVRIVTQLVHTFPLIASHTLEKTQNQYPLLDVANKFMISQLKRVEQ